MTQEEKKMKQEVDTLLDKLDVLDEREDALDEVVNTRALEVADEANSDGAREQLKFLLASGLTPEKIIRRVEEE